MTNNTTAKTAKNAKEFICEKCDFKCSKNSNYISHLATAKHQLLITDCVKPAKIYTCICGKEYKHNPSLSHHKKKCPQINQNEINSKMIELLKQNNYLLIQNQELKHIILEQKEVLVEQKEEKQGLKEMFIEQTEHNKKVLEIALEQKEIALEQKEYALEQKELLEQIKEKGLGTGTVINNHFNIHNFLNITCKDALNVDEFYKTIMVSDEHINLFQNKKHNEVINDIIKSNIENTPVNQRPIHCTDLKREQFQVKKDNVWIKEDCEGKHVNEVVKVIENKTFDAFVLNKPNMTDDEFDTGILNVTGYYGKEEKSRTKMVSQLARSTYVNKELD